MIISGTFGRTELPPRFIRFFNTIYLPELEEESLVLIFSEITRGFFQRFKIKNEIMELITNKSIVNSTLNLYAMVRAELLPTPEKSHYSFNLRDVSRVFQGLSLVKQSTLSSPEVLVKLWVHEFQRVFEDRLINEKDKMFIREELGKKVAVSLKSHLTQETLFESPIFFCSFLRKGQEKKDWLYE
jgi:dynein heavy chain, axonemal